MKRKLLPVIMGALIAAGLGVLFYPSISEWYNAQYQIRAIVSYDDTIEKMSEQMIEEELRKAREHNRTLTEQTIFDPFIPGGMTLSETYTSIMNTNNGIMGSIQIPVIDVNLPIYHGTGADVLAKGVGHMEMTPFPIGGPGNHSVLTGHTALPDARLFTDLIKLKEGDVFYIHIYKEIFAYQVDQISVVKPDNTKLLLPESGRDYVSLVTCTPYGINSHRLLVRGTRIPYEAAVMEQQPGVGTAAAKVFIHYDLVIALVMLFLVIIFLVIIFLAAARFGKHRRQGGGPDNRE